jgi:hypothetical protein
MSKAWYTLNVQGNIVKLIEIRQSTHVGNRKSRNIHKSVPCMMEYNVVFSKSYDSGKLIDAKKSVDTKVNQGFIEEARTNHKFLRK